jgi:MOSC domain-containing protein YiiM
MEFKEEADLEAGRGLVGDRYHSGIGTYSADLEGSPDVQLTLLEIEEIRRFNIERRLQLNPAELRRNVVTRGLRLKDLIGARFRIGGVTLEGLRMCEPCAHLARNVSQRILPDLVHRTGLRASILSSGTIRIGEKIARIEDAVDTSDVFEYPTIEAAGVLQP